MSKASKRPNVARMRKVLARDEAHRMRRNPEFRVSMHELVSLDDLGHAERTAGAWTQKVWQHFPSAEIHSHDDPYRDERVFRFSVPPRH